MTQYVYNVKDTKSEYFLTPFHVAKEEMAMRNIRAAVFDDEHPFGKNPQDFDLYYLGEFDDNTGIFEMLDSPKHICKLDSLRPVAPELPNIGG